MGEYSVPVFIAVLFAGAVGLAVTGYTFKALQETAP